MTRLLTLYRALAKEGKRGVGSRTPAARRRHKSSTIRPSRQSDHSLSLSAPQTMGSAGSRSVNAKASFDGHYFSFKTGGDPAHVVDRFEARIQNDMVRSATERARALPRVLDVRCARQSASTERLHRNAILMPPVAPATLVLDHRSPTTATGLSGAQAESTQPPRIRWSRTLSPATSCTAR